MTYSKPKWFTVPNVITLTGILCLIALWVVPSAPWRLALLLAYGSCELLDGITARLLHQRTDVGERFDLFSDWCFLAVGMGMCVRGIETVAVLMPCRIILFVLACGLVVYELYRAVTRIRMSHSGWIHKAKMVILFGVLLVVVALGVQWTITTVVMFVGVDCLFVCIERFVRDPEQSASP